MPKEKREISKEDIMPLDVYTKNRRELRKNIVDFKKDRRVALGPYATFYFESYETMLAQVQEMLYIEKGGEEQLKDELAAYNPLVPNGKELTATLPVILVLAALMLLTMTLSDVLNNVATALIAAPVALDIALQLEVNPDPFLMAVAVAASCAFLTPIGHKNNTLIMGPGGYRFGDYWRMGLPLELLVIFTALPMIVFVWPL